MASLDNPIPSDWRPGADLTYLRLRARLLQATRNFFAERDVLEVETALISRGGNPDVHIDSLTCRFAQGTASDGLHYLNTSPEFAMKRLLATDSGPIYQICKAFRDGEQGQLHNPEFTILEWYRPAYDYRQLMLEVEALLRNLGLLTADDTVPVLTYRELFQQYADFDPLTVASRQLLDHVRRAGIALSDSYIHQCQQHPDAHRNELLDLILSHQIEPALAQVPWLFVIDYPADQAALARLKPDDPAVAERFELFAQGVELANGFSELTDAVQQRERFVSQNRERVRQQRQAVVVDERLLAALEHGLDDCAGVALGFDRLVMLAAGESSLAAVLAFDIGRA